MSTMIEAAPAVKPIPAVNPRDAWPAWTDQGWTLAPDDDLAGEPMDGRDDEPYEPSPSDQARDLGYRLGLAGERAFLHSRNPGWNRDVAWQFALGQIDGHAERTRREAASDLDEQSWLATLDDDALAEHFHVERSDADHYPHGGTT